LEFFRKALESGCLVSIPTETVYGLAGLALDQDICRSIFTVKGRPLVDPLIVHVQGLEMAGQVAEITPEAKRLAERFWPGPLTLILRKRRIVPDLVTAGKPTVAVRMPNHPVTAELLRLLDKPLAAPSANPFGYVSPTRPEHVRDSFGDRVPFIIDGGPCDIGIESSIIDLSEPGQPRMLRPGAISCEDIENVMGTPVEVTSPSLATSEVADAPGTFAKHYSPRTELELFPEGQSPSAEPGSALLYLRRPVSASVSNNDFWLSEDGDDRSISQSLFQLLRQLDQSGYRKILCEVPSSESTGIRLAIRDRLNRAASK